MREHVIDTVIGLLGEWNFKIDFGAKRPLMQDVFLHNNWFSFNSLSPYATLKFETRLKISIYPKKKWPDSYSCTFCPGSLLLRESILGWMPLNHGDYFSLW